MPGSGRCSETRGQPTRPWRFASGGTPCHSTWSTPRIVWHRRATGANSRLRAAWQWLGPMAMGTEVDKYCGTCAAPVITACEKCGAAIPKIDLLGGDREPRPCSVPTERPRSFITSIIGCRQAPMPWGRTPSEFGSTYRAPSFGTHRIRHPSGAQPRWTSAPDVVGSRLQVELGSSGRARTLGRGSHGSSSIPS